ncbi:hypothetical protein JI667_02395 [Bacillus sp. NTK074B]|uniref:hypothetical protein n=1 Tax=Bacillus sp. NTK074B TaxID=2802174 RepID=UPI001A8D045A|nr:hypothetical protein [Bacillus sp. NTK074B]
MTRTKDLKTETIIREIQFWKQTKLLPEQYCDYLLAFYTGGEEINVGNQTLIRRSFTYIDVLISVCILAISLFVIYFTELSIVLQTTILAGFVGLLLGMGIYYTKKQISPMLLYASAASILLLSSIDVAEVVFKGSPLELYITLFLNCFLWIVAGVKWKLNYFSVAGIIGVVFVSIYILL